MYVYVYVYVCVCTTSSNPRTGTRTKLVVREEEAATGTLVEGLCGAANPRVRTDALPHHGVRCETSDRPGERRRVGGRRLAGDGATQREEREEADAEGDGPGLVVELALLGVRDRVARDRNVLHGGHLSRARLHFAGIDLQAEPAGLTRGGHDSALVEQRTSKLFCGAKNN